MNDYLIHFFINANSEEIPLEFVKIDPLSKYGYMVKVHSVNGKCSEAK